MQHGLHETAPSLHANSGRAPTLSLLSPMSETIRLCLLPFHNVTTADPKSAAFLEVARSTPLTHSLAVSCVRHTVNMLVMQAYPNKRSADEPEGPEWALFEYLEDFLDERRNVVMEPRWLRIPDAQACTVEQYLAGLRHFIELSEEPAVLQVLNIIRLQEQIAAPLNVDLARSIGRRHGRRAVIVIGFGNGGAMEVVTWGRDPADKLEAADRGRNIMEKVLGFEPGPYNEDFRIASETQAVNEKFVLLLEQAVIVLDSVVQPGMSIPLRRRIQAALDYWRKPTPKPPTSETTASHDHQGQA